MWDMVSQQIEAERRRMFVQALLSELVLPMGLPNEFVVEFFAPTLDEYEVFHNLDEGTDSPAEALERAD